MNFEDIEICLQRNAGYQWSVKTKDVENMQKVLNLTYWDLPSSTYEVAKQLLGTDNIESPKERGLRIKQSQEYRVVLRVKYKRSWLDLDFYSDGEGHYSITSYHDFYDGIPAWYDSYDMKEFKNFDQFVKCMKSYKDRDTTVILYERDRG